MCKIKRHLILHIMLLWYITPMCHSTEIDRVAIDTVSI